MAPIPVFKIPPLVFTKSKSFEDDFKNRVLKSGEIVSLPEDAVLVEMLEISDVEKKDEEFKCPACQTYRKISNNGERYLCNHFSGSCPTCNTWVKEKHE